MPAVRSSAIPEAVYHGVHNEVKKEVDIHTIMTTQSKAHFSSYNATGQANPIMHMCATETRRSH